MTRARGTYRPAGRKHAAGPPPPRTVSAGPRRASRARPGKDAASALNLALAFHRQGALEQAQSICEALLREQPDDIHALNLLSTLRREAGHREDAVDLLRRALRLAPRQPGLHYNLALALQAMDQPREALAAYDRAIALRPDYAEAHSNRGIVLRQLERLEEALASYDQAIALRPDYPEAHSNRGIVLRQLERLDEALASYDRAIALRPDYPEAHSNRGSVLRELDRPTEALVSYERAIALKPDYAEAHLNRAVTLRRLMRPEEALAAYERAIALRPDYPEAYANRGIVLKELRRLDEALASYDRAIALRPDYAEAHSNRGNVLLDLRRFEEALASYDRAIALRPDYPEAHSNRGIALDGLGRPEEALASYDRAVALKADYAQAHSNRGIVLKQLRRFEEALASYDRAIALHPDYPEAYSNRGIVLKELQRLDEAVTSYDRAIALKPGYAEAYSNRGNVLMDLGRLDEALASYDRAIALKPDYAQAYANRGIVLKKLKRLEEALASHERAIELRPDHAEAYSARGLVLGALKRFDEALASYQRAIELRPDFAEAYSNRGVLLRELEDLQGALASYERALELRPDYPEALSNRANALVALRRFDQALAGYERAIALRPDYADAHFNLSLCLLLLGDFARGWQEYEWRWRKEDFPSPKRRFDQPLWLGAEDVEGRTVLLHSEQGLGDAIQFCRYATLAAARKVRVVLEVPGTLRRLLARLEGVDRIVVKDEPLPDFDLHCPLLSLPLAFATRLDTVPALVPYITAPPELVSAWDDRLGPKGGPRIGLVWSGNPKHKNDHNRSLELSSLQPLLRPGLELFSLQKEARPKDRATLERTPAIRHFGADLRDLADTAALVSLMDLVISVDTAVAHLAGAMGRPTWVLLPHVPDWRWLLDRDDSPWYPSARLFRQPQRGDWDGVIRQVAHALEQRWPELPRDTAAPRPARSAAAGLAPSSPGRQSHSPDGLLAEAVALQQQGFLDRAQSVYESILREDPDNVDALHLLGVVFGQRGRHEQAVALMEKALRLAPALADAHFNLALSLTALSRTMDALASFDRAIALKPDAAQAYANRGILLGELQRFDDALASFERAIALTPDHAEAYYCRGNVLKKLGRLDEALASHERAIELRPDYPEACSNRGTVLLELQRLEEALASFDRAIALRPSYAQAHANRGNVLLELGKIEEALASCERAIALAPDFAEAHFNRGNILRQLRRVEEALASYERAIALKPDFAGAHFNMSVCLLLVGDFARGWQEYEWRWQKSDAPPPRRQLDQPLWLGGESLEGRRVLLHAEQGLGDTIQFCRFATMVAAKGAQVVLEVPGPLKSLLATLEGIHLAVAKGEALPGFDFHCPLLSLPLAFATRLDTIPAAVPYIAASPESISAWNARLGPKERPRIGLVWSGSPRHKNDRNRSLELSSLLPLLRPGLEFFSLQKEARPEDRAALAHAPAIRHFGDDLSDFSDTAALLSLMDLVISVDTAVAHLAGAMGRATWVLLPHVPDWRWLLDRDDSPWYPSARLFRQAQRGDWAGVIRQVADALAAAFPKSRPLPIDRASNDARHESASGNVERLSELYCLVRGRHGLFLANRHDMYVGRALIEYGEYSEKEWLLLAQLCQAGHVVVEVGANTGVHTVSLAKAVGPNGLVIAIEPQPFVYQNLCANIALNSLTNVVAMQCGCAERPGQLIVPPIDYAKTGNFGGVSLHETGPGTRIDVHRLDDLFRWPTLRLLKIDVEGMEQKVLSGAQHAIEKFKPTLYVENDRVANSPSLIEFLWDLGYSMWWHITPLFDNENYFKEKENIYGTVASINMLCIHRDHKANIAGLPAVTDSIYHPLSQPKGGLADASVPPPQSIRVKR